MPSSGSRRTVQSMQEPWHAGPPRSQRHRAWQSGIERRSRDMRRVVYWPRPSSDPDTGLIAGDGHADVVIAACPECQKQFAPSWDYCIRCGRNLHQPFTTTHKLRHALCWFVWLPLMRQWPIGYVTDVSDESEAT